MKLFKKLFAALLFVCIATVACYAQNVFFIKGKWNLNFLNGQERLNVVFDYSDLKIQGHKEMFYVEMRGQLWAEEWEDAKVSKFPERFFYHLNKNINADKSLLLCRAYTEAEAQYQATVRVLVISNYEIRCEVIFTKSGDTVPLAIIAVRGGRCGDAKISRIERAFGDVGQNLGKFMANKIK